MNKEYNDGWIWIFLGLVLVFAEAKWGWLFVAVGALLIIFDPLDASKKP